jgi:Ca-activated chloride channel homolog
MRKETNSMNSLPITLHVSADCSLLSDAETTTRLLRVTVAAANAAPKPDRLPINLALVLDRSGSMQGAKIHYARQALSHALDLLTPLDWATVVTFDDQIEVMAPPQPMKPHHRSGLQARLQHVYPRNSTNLCGGWLEGATQATTAYLERGINRVLLFTDGLANVGETHPEVLIKHARNLRQRGLSTSTFGVGLDYNHDLLEQIATQGGGQYHYIETPQQIPEMFARELDELLTMAASRMEIIVKTPAQAEMKLLGGLSHTATPGRLSIPLGDLCAGRTVEYFIELQTPAKPAGTEVPFAISAEWYDEEGQEQKLQRTLGFTYAAKRDVDAAAIDLELRQAAALMDMTEAETQAYRYQAEGRFEEAANTVARAAQFRSANLSNDIFENYMGLSGRLGTNAVPLAEQRRRHHDSHRRAHGRGHMHTPPIEPDNLPPGVPAFEYHRLTPRLLAGRNPLTKNNVAQLQWEGVTHIVDLREPVEWTHPRLGEEALHALNGSGIERLHLPIADGTAPTPQQFERAVSHLKTVLAQPDTQVYVHCRAGQGRTSAILMAFLAATEGITCHQALRQLRQSRRALAPTPDQMTAALAWCKACDGR